MAGQSEAVKDSGVMWELFEMIFGALFDVGAFLSGWRFYFCLVTAAVLIALIYAQVESETLSLS